MTRARAERRARRQTSLGPDLGDRAGADNKIADTIEANWRRSRSPRPGRTASQSGRAWRPTCRWRSTTSATSRGRSGPRRAACPKSRPHHRLPLPRAARRRRETIPRNFPILMATWKLAPALAGATARPSSWPSRRVVAAQGDPAHRRPAPGGRGQRGQRLRRRGGQAAGVVERIAKIAFTGETTTGPLIMQYASQNLIPAMLELGGRARTSSSRMSGRRMTTSTTSPRGFHHVRPQPGRGLTCRSGRWSSSRSTSGSWLTRSPGRRPSSRGIRSTSTR